jgi:hypothetical protein
MAVDPSPSPGVWLTRWESWSTKFGQVDKWNFYLKAARMPRIRSDYGKTNTPEAYPGLRQKWHWRLPGAIVQILVAVVFTRGAPGQRSQQAAFLISQTLFRDANGWRITTTLPVADTQLK